MANLTDGILAEGGFATWNPRPNTTSRFVAPPKTSPDKFSRQVRFVRNMQRHGKAFFAINEWGAGADYGLNPSEVPYNITGPHNRGIRQFVTAAYMMVNGGSAGVFLTCIQCYGGHAGGLGNLSIWREYAAPVGFPLGEPAIDANTGVWSREYSNGVALVNPNNMSQTALLPHDAGADWHDLYGNRQGGGAVTLEAASGLVLLKQAAAQVV